MHRLQRWNLARSRARALRALGLGAAVLLAHVLLLQLGASPLQVAPARSAAIEIRQLALAPPAPAPPIAAPPALPTPVPAQPTRVAREPKASAARRAATPAPDAPAPVVPHEGAAERATVAPPPDVSVPIRVPPSTDLVYALQRGMQSGEARLSWRAEGERYALSLHATLPSGREIEQHSQGGFDAAGIAPLRLADRRRGRDVRAANFQREHGKVTFSGPRWELPLEAGTQDRLSWLVQLVALVGAVPEGLREGSELAMWVVGARGAASHWRFEVRGRQRVALEAQPVETWWLVREPAHPYDLRVEVWLDPQQGHWPLKLRQTQIPGGEPLDWSLRDAGPASSPGT
jgi:hypothetical protein